MSQNNPLMLIFVWSPGVIFLLRHELFLTVTVNDGWVGSDELFQFASPSENIPGPSTICQPSRYTFELKYVRNLWLTLYFTSPWSASVSYGRHCLLFVRYFPFESLFLSCRKYNVLRSESGPVVWVERRAGKIAEETLCALFHHFTIWLKPNRERFGKCILSRKKYPTVVRALRHTATYTVTTTPKF